MSEEQAVEPVGPVEQRAADREVKNLQKKVARLQRRVEKATSRANSHAGSRRAAVQTTMRLQNIIRAAVGMRAAVTVVTLAHTERLLAGIMEDAAQSRARAEAAERVATAEREAVEARVAAARHAAGVAAQLEHRAQLAAWDAELADLRLDVARQTQRAEHAEGREQELRAQLAAAQAQANKAERGALESARLLREQLGRDAGLQQRAAAAAAAAALAEKAREGDEQAATIVSLRSDAHEAALELARERRRAKAAEQRASAAEAQAAKLGAQVEALTKRATAAEQAAHRLTATPAERQRAGERLGASLPIARVLDVAARRALVASEEPLAVAIVRVAVSSAGAPMDRAQALVALCGAWVRGVR